MHARASRPEAAREASASLPDQALNAHAAAPHMKAYAAKTKDMIASRIIHVLAPA
jgi:hypothetical protein